MKNKVNKSLAGYRMLVLLSHVDGNVGSKEDALITDYMKKSFPEKSSLDYENNFLNKLDHSEYLVHFSKAMDEFYLNSTPEERSGFVDFAMKMAKADNKITREENVLLDELFNGWDPDSGE